MLTKDMRGGGLEGWQSWLSRLLSLRANPVTGRLTVEPPDHHGRTKPGHLEAEWQAERREVRKRWHNPQKDRAAKGSGAPLPLLHRGHHSGVRTPASSKEECGAGRAVRGRGREDGTHLHVGASGGPARDLQRGGESWALEEKNGRALVRGGVGVPGGRQQRTLRG